MLDKSDNSLYYMCKLSRWQIMIRKEGSVVFNRSPQKNTNSLGKDTSRSPAKS